MNLTIKTPNGSNIKLLAAKDGTVGQLKDQIKKHLGFAPNEQKLLFNDAILNVDNKRLSECGISDGSAINFSFYPSKFKVDVHFLDGRQYTVEVDKKDTIGRLKSEMQRVHSIPIGDYIILYNGNSIINDSSLFNLGITDYCVLVTIPRMRNDMQIIAKTMDGKTVALDICKNEKIIDIKKKVHEKIGLEPDEQKLVYQGALLENDKTADEYQIFERSVINVVARLRNGMQIFVKTLEGKTVALEICKSKKIKYIKKKVHEKMGLVPEEQKLVFQGRILEDDKTLNEYEITYQSVINVVAPLRNGTQIFVSTVNGRTVAVVICKNEKISDIKKKVQRIIGYTPEEQSLFFNAEVLEDDKTADEYQIEERSVINVVARLRKNGIKIFVRTMDGKTFPLYICKNEKISDVKKKLQKEIELAPEEQSLVFNSEILEDDKTASESKIVEGSVINV